MPDQADADPGQAAQHQHQAEKAERGVGTIRREPGEAGAKADLLVFDLFKPHNLKRVVLGEEVGTLVTG